MERTLLSAAFDFARGTANKKFSDTLHQDYKGKYILGTLL